MLPVACVVYHLSHVTYHVSSAKTPQPQPQTFPLLTPQLGTVGWFAKTHKLKKLLKNEEKNIKIFREIRRGSLFDN